MTIEPIPGEPLRYRFPSRTEGDADHVIDLSVGNGNGQCSCQDWEFRRGPNYSKTGEIVHFYQYLAEDGKLKVGKDCTQCFHVHSALLHLATSVAREAGHVARPAPVTIRESRDGLPF